MNSEMAYCVEKPENFRTSTGFEPVTSRYRCDALTNSKNVVLFQSISCISTTVVEKGITV